MLLYFKYFNEWSVKVHSSTNKSCLSLASRFLGPYLSVDSVKTRFFFQIVIVLNFANLVFGSGLSTGLSEYVPAVDRHAMTARLEMWLARRTF